MTVVAAFSDAFILPMVWEQAFRKHLRPVVEELEFVFGLVDWPAIPLQDNQEIKEFVGDIEETAALAERAEVIVTHVAPITRAVIERARNLKIIGCCRGGPVNVNLRAATELGIPVLFTPGRNAQAVVEFTLGLLLTECKGIARAHRALAQGIWQGEYYRYDHAPVELVGKTIGLVGFGAIAQMLVPYLRQFGMRILAYDPYIPAEIFRQPDVEQAELHELLSASDVVSLHARVTPETVKMLGENEFRQMKAGAYFINTARGPLVDYEALFRALRDGHLAGAGLDTFSEEPPPVDWPLLALENVTLTPHYAGSSRETAHRSAEIIARDVANFYAGQPLSFCANPQALSAPPSPTITLQIS